MIQRHSTADMKAMTLPAPHTQVLNLFTFCHWLSGKKYLQDSFYSLAQLSRCQAPQANRASQTIRTPLTHRASSPFHKNVLPEPQEQVLLKVLPFACGIPPLKFCQTLPCFHPTFSSTTKRKYQAITEPDSKNTSSSSSDSSSTVDTSRSETKDEKDFILSDFSSDELTSSNLSDSEPEDAYAKNLSFFSMAISSKKMFKMS